jgi:hypothetical protein
VSSPSSEPFLCPDSIHLGDMVADAAVRILEQTAITGLSSRAVAAWLRVSPSALTQRADRAELIRLIVIFFVDRWSRWVDVSPWHDLPARLPHSAEELHGIRVWHALAELARGEALAGNPVPAELITQAREDERLLVRDRLGGHLGRPPSDAEVATVTALVAGLRLELAAAQPAITPMEAVDLLRAHVRGMLRLSPSG